MKILRYIMLCSLLWALQGPHFAYAAIPLTVEVNKSLVLDLSPITKLAVANPEIADVYLSGEQLLVIGKKSGVTSLQIWQAGRLLEYDISVEDRGGSLMDVLVRTLGYKGVAAIKQDKTIILTGVVENQDQKNRAEQVASAYGEKVVNLLGLAHNTQVKIEAKIIEISRSKLNELGINWGNDPTTKPGKFAFGQSSTNTVSSQAAKLKWLGTYSDINGKLSALVTNGSATVLSQPDIITTSGSKANILVGGEIPVPVSATDGQITVEWKSYGIKLFIEPQVGEDEMITSKIQAEVSSLDFTNTTATVKISDSYVIPALRTDKAETVIRLASGQPMLIGGLLFTDRSNTVNKLPLLGDLPGIGHFFKSTSSTSERKELIIIVTPTLITDNNYQASLSDSMREALQQEQKGAVQNEAQRPDSGNK